MLSTTEEQVNLIMDSNITRSGKAIKNSNDINDENLFDWHTAWVNEEDYKAVGGTLVLNKSDGGGTIQAASDKGPVSALKYLTEATKNWEGIDSDNIRLSKKEEINNLFTNKTYSMDNFRMEYLPLWAINYLYNDKEGIKELAQISPDIYGTNKATAYVVGKTHIEKLGSYWLLDSIDDSFVYEVGIDAGYYGFGRVYGDISTFSEEYDLYDGIRPVISLAKTKISK